MTKINLKRLLLGSVAAGVILNIITGVTNACILNTDFLTWAAEMGERLHPPTQPTQILLWTLMGFLDALVGVWIYIGLRPRFGAGPKTAFLAGLAIWIVGRVCVAIDMMALGVFPLHLMLGQSILGLIAILSAVLVGAWIYRE